MAEAQLAARVGQIRVNGTYLGLLEWVAFVALEKVRVEMLFGQDVVDVCEICAPALGLGSDCRRVCHNAAVRVGSKGQLLSALKANGARYPDINHYVIGQAASGPGLPTTAKCGFPPVPIDVY